MTVLRILLVEDETLIALSASTALEEAGHHVTVAMDGREALQLAHRDQPELIITDFMMPRMNGLELVRRLRETGFCRPIILTTSVPEEKLPHRPGYNGYVSKPYQERDLLAEIERQSTRVASAGG